MSIRTAAAGTVAAMTISGAVLAGTTGAQADDAGRSLAGTWRVMVQPLDGPSLVPFESTLAYTATGSVVEATSKAPASAGLGTWERLGSGKFAMSFEKYRFNGAEYIGKTRIVETQTVDPDGERYTGTATTYVTDRAGAVVMTFTSRTSGSRL